jgi:hypothetical protein
MTINQFEELSISLKAITLNKYGVFLCQRAVGPNRLYLYTISSFYIELLHDLADSKNGGIRILSVFDDPKYLDPYLEDFDILSQEH